MTKTPTKFRYDINALRGIAVLGVILFHFKVPYFNGGFSGVDIFFVISGYLMTKIVINGLGADKFSLLDFYIRRGIRILPALIFLVLIVVLITFFLYLPMEYKEVMKNAGASLLFFSNVLYAKTDYFAPSSDNNMFLHTWSLSVEWQFYLILPIILILFNKIFRNNKNLFIILFSVLITLSFLTLLYFTESSPTKAFYYLPTRSWEMLAGGVAFLIEDRIKWRYNKLTAIVGYLILIGCVIGLDEQMNWPGFYTVIPVFGTFLIIISNYNDFTILKSKVVLFMGNTSYSAYLWHWPIYVIATYIGFTLDFKAVLVFLLTSGLLAWISYTFIEHSKLNITKNVIIGTVSLVAVLIIFQKINPNKIVFKKETLLIAEYGKNHHEEIEKQMTSNCLVTVWDGQKKFHANEQQCIGIQHNKKNILLLGDSHSGHLSGSLRAAFDSVDVHLIQASITGCMPILRANGNKDCSEMISYIYNDFIPKNAKDIDGVIISANWINSKNQETMISDIKATLNYLNKMKIKTIILGQSETYTRSFASVASREYQNHVKLSDNFIDYSSTEINSLLMKNLKPYYVKVYNINPKRLNSENVPYMWDHNHYTKYGADYVTGKIFATPLFREFLNAAGVL